jgi:hypothetical protein
MSAEHNIETARQTYEAFGRGDVQAVLDRVTDDVDWSTDAAIESAPWYGPRHGKDGVAAFFEAIGKTGPVLEFNPLGMLTDQVVHPDPAGIRAGPSRFPCIYPAKGCAA